MTSGQVKQSELINGLTPKQEAFCLHYLACKNASEAVRRAGYSPDNADVTGAQNLVNPSIQARLDYLRKTMAVSADMTVADLAKRRSRLMEIVDHPIEVPVSAGHIIAASHQLNLIDKVYAIDDNRGVQVVIVTGIPRPESAQSTQPVIEGEAIRQIEANT